jgi:outer membrane cobalamin receptor
VESSLVGRGRVCLLFAFFLLFMPSALGQNHEKRSVFDMSLEELMTLEVKIGSLTGTKWSNMPVPVTVITREQIAVTPARNLADLLEIYVPGALWLRHNDARIGMRGVIIDRNYKLLLLINGHNINNKSSQGAVVEIMNWDLHDIERVEVIRGPGSVTYGPGAIAGIINIITKTGRTSPGISVGANWNVRYRSSGGYGQYGYSDGENDLFVHASFQNADGVEDPEYFQMRPDGDHGYIGSDLEPDAKLVDYFSDVLDPQMKLHVDFGLGDAWRFFGRYSSYEHAGHKVLLKDADGEFYPRSFVDHHLIFVGAEHTAHPRDDLSLVSDLSYRSEHFFMTDLRNGVEGENFDYDEGVFRYSPHPGHVKYNSAENEILFKSTASYQHSDRADLALGGSLSYSWLEKSPFWNTDTPHDWVMLNVLSRTTEDGRLIQDEIGDGFDTMTYSVFGEANVEVFSKLDLLLSARLDQNEWSKLLFSPRIGVISEINERHSVRATWQQAQRMNTLTELFIEDLHDVESDPEELEGYELMYSWLPHPDIHFGLAGFYNELDAIGWAGTKTVNLGDVTIGGVEAEFAYHAEQFNAGVSHAFTRQIDFDSADPTSRQGISYADYAVPVDVDGDGTEETLKGEGNALANFPENVTKCYLTYSELPWDMVFHTDAAVFWGYPGLEDMLDMYEDVHEDKSSEPTMETLESRLDHEDFADLNVLWNCSLGRTFMVNDCETTLSLYAMNLLNFKRYQYVSGESAAFPRIARWTEEPRSFGIELDVRF